MYIEQTEDSLDISCCHSQRLSVVPVDTGKITHLVCSFPKKTEIKSSFCSICQSSVVLKKFLEIPEADEEVITDSKSCTIENPQKLHKPIYDSTCKYLCDAFGTLLFSVFSPGMKKEEEMLVVHLLVLRLPGSTPEKQGAGNFTAAKFLMETSSLQSARNWCCRGIVQLKVLSHEDRKQPSLKLKPRLVWRPLMRRFDLLDSVKTNTAIVPTSSSHQ
ncbi:hypothetical protein EK904_007715 [Melospiza melodia maxima]|nr:hypothetical protein EK904_007715 [Melospiza melodia maxima]